MSDKHLREFVVNWKNNLLAIKRGKGSMDVFYEDNMNDKVLFSSPAIHKPSDNRMYIKTILNWVIEIVEDFHYTDIDYYDYKTNRVAMIFAGKVRDSTSDKYLQVEGIDLIQLNDDGKVVELKVMIRPLNALIVVATTMKNRFKKLSKL